MDVSDPRTELHFSQPVRQIVLMLLVLGLVASGGTLAAPRVLPVFEANPRTSRRRDADRPERSVVAIIFLMIYFDLI